jgi:hypothetical protein
VIDDAGIRLFGEILERGIELLAFEMLTGFSA